jgi:hypothetical protein
MFLGKLDDAKFEWFRNKAYLISYKPRTFFQKLIENFQIEEKRQIRINKNQA